MKIATHSVASSAGNTRVRGLFLIIFLLVSGCTVSLQPVRPEVYDFGPGPLGQQGVLPTVDAAAASPLIIGEIEALPALDSTAVQYRLAYADAQQLKPYARARWSMAPAQLVRQRLREQLGRGRTLLNPGEGDLSGPGAPVTLRVELEEFSQLYQAADQSVGLLRLRATLTRTSLAGNTRVAQRVVVVQRPAPSADAAGGVRALTAATDAAVQEIAQWLREMGV